MLRSMAESLAFLSVSTLRFQRCRCFGTLVAFWTPPSIEVAGARGIGDGTAGMSARENAFRAVATRDVTAGPAALASPESARTGAGRFGHREQWVLSSEVIPAVAL